MLPFRFLAAALLAGAISAPVPGDERVKNQPKPARTDVYGDPLPEGAIARMGKSGFRNLGVVRALAWSWDGITLASGGHDRIIRVWEAATGKEVRQLAGHEHHVYSLSWSPNGQMLASASYDHTIRLWVAATGKEVQRLSGHDAGVWSVAWSPDSKTLASGSEDRTVRLWDVKSGKETRRLAAHEDWVRSLAWSPDGKTLASGSSDATIGLWDAATGALVRRLAGHTDRVFSVAWLPDGKTLASSSDDKTIRLWQAATGKERRQIGGHKSPLFYMAWSPDGRILATSSADATVRLWEAVTGAEFRRLDGHADGVSSLAWSPDGKTLASGSWDATVLVWDVAGARSGIKPDLSSDRLSALWDHLAADPPRAFEAIWALTAASSQAVPFLRERLQPDPGLDPRRVARLIADLDSNEFAVREKAYRELAALADSVEPALRKVLDGKPPLEVRKRVERLLERVAVMSGDRLRVYRGIMALEYIGSTEARQVLEKLATGAVDSPLTQEARASLDRLAWRASRR